MRAHTSRTWFGLFAAAMLLGGMASPVFAAEGAPSYTDDALRKLGRGLANIASCPAELIRTSELVGRKDGYVAALSVGLVQGAFRVVARGAVGIFEVATFYVGIPKGFRPIIQPEFVYAHGDWVE